MRPSVPGGDRGRPREVFWRLPTPKEVCGGQRKCAAMVSLTRRDRQTQRGPRSPKQFPFARGVRQLSWPPDRSFISCVRFHPPESLAGSRRGQTTLRPRWRSAHHPSLPERGRGLILFGALRARSSEQAFCPFARWDATSAQRRALAIPFAEGYGGCIFQNSQSVAARANKLGDTRLPQIRRRLSWLASREINPRRSGPAQRPRALDQSLH
jgi:hypothetical protein